MKKKKNFIKNLTKLITNYLYEKKPLGLFLINAGYALAGNIIAGVIICSWF